MVKMTKHCSFVIRALIAGLQWPHKSMIDIKQ
jgi:hypothetical protein